MLALDGDQDGDNFISFFLRHLFSSSAAATVFKKNHTRQILTVAQTFLKRKKNTERINTERENPECHCKALCSYYRRSLGSRMNMTYFFSNFKGESRIVKLGIFGGAQ